MNKAFTLIELLVVIAIMGLMGTASVGGYRQMQRGMEERGALEALNQFIRVASQRAQIDRQPTAILFWNETIQGRGDDDNEIVVGRAVAVRRRGRITRIDGQCLIDEFGDLEVYNEDGTYAEADKVSTTMKIYQLDNPRNGLKYTTVYDMTRTASGDADGGQDEIYLTEDARNIGNGTVGGKQIIGTGKSDTSCGGKGRIIQFGYYKDSSGKDTASWKVGDPYGLEFQSFELPHNFIFGSSYSQTLQNPVVEVDTLVFDAVSGSTSGAALGKSTITVCALRPDTSGNLKAIKVGTSDAPDARLNN